MMVNKVYRKRRHKISKKDADKMLNDVMYMSRSIFDIRDSITCIIDKISSILHVRDLEFGESHNHEGDIFLESRMAAECDKIQKENAEADKKVECDVDERSLMDKIHRRKISIRASIEDEMYSFGRKMIIITILIAASIAFVVYGAIVSSTTHNRMFLYISWVVEAIIFAIYSNAILKHIDSMKDNAAGIIPNKDGQVLEFLSYTYYRLNWEKVLCRTEEVSILMARAITAQSIANEKLLEIGEKIHDLEEDQWITTEDAHKYYTELMHWKTYINKWCEEKLNGLVNLVCTSSNDLYRFSGLKVNEKDLAKFICIKDPTTGEETTAPFDTDNLSVLINPFIDNMGKTI